MADVQGGEQRCHNSCHHRQPLGKLLERGCSCFPQPGLRRGGWEAGALPRKEQWKSAESQDEDGPLRHCDAAPPGPSENDRQDSRSALPRMPPPMPRQACPLVVLVTPQSDKGNTEPIPFSHQALTPLEITILMQVLNTLIWSFKN